MISYTESQVQRLRELGEDVYSDARFESESEREKSFSKEMAKLKASNDKQIDGMFERPERSALARLESDLADLLVGKGFIEVKTPSIMSVASLEKMTVTRDSPLFRQVFFVDEKRCLRPMLAPNLYFVMRKLRDRTDGPVRIFEIGSCYRKESRSTYHLEEFTMLNFVELGAKNPDEGLRKCISDVMGAAGLDYEIVSEESDVYGTTVDVETDGQEIASGAVGPHPLDAAHDIHEPWFGAGFGLERIIMAKSGRTNIKKAGRTLVYLNGAKID